MCDLSLESTEVNSINPQFWSVQARLGYGARHDGKRHESPVCQDCLLETFVDPDDKRCSQDLPSPDDSGLFYLGDYHGVQWVKVSSPGALSSEEFDEMMRLYDDAGDWMRAELKAMRKLVQLDK